jgi:hypothetical protein
MLKPPPQPSPYVQHFAELWRRKYHMTTKAQWIALADRCETATGSDRDIDAAIMFDAFAKPVGVMSDGGPRGYLWPDDNPSWNFGMRFPGKDRDWFNQTRAKDEKETLLLERDGALVLMNDIRIPRLTASIDAITALIERELPGWFYGSWRGTMRKSHGTFWAEVYFMNGSTEKWLLVDVFGDPIMSPGATEALARCAAFCRAMAEKVS